MDNAQEDDERPRSGGGREDHWSGGARRLRLRSTSHALVTLVLVFVLQTLAQTEAICPARCNCNDNGLRVRCVNTALEYVPIQLNPELQHLNLSHNKISNVHYTLRFYNSLQMLDLSYNKIQTLGSSNFESQHHLIYLNLSNNFISNLSKDTFKGLKQLEQLDLSFNQLFNIISSAFCDLKCLRVFYLNNNDLISFEPDLFKHVTKLTTLVLNWNQLLEVPENILSWTKAIERLELSHNLIEQVADGAIMGLTNLQYLALDSNVISDISSIAFDELPALQYLDLSDNNLTSVPTQQMSKLSNLTILKLSGNFIEHIEALAFRSLFQLRNLFLSRLDRLISIDARAFVDNVNLEKVWMESNPQLCRIPTRMFHGSARVTHISLRNNALETLEPAHFPLDQLASLKLSGGNFVCNCSLTWLWKLLKEDEGNWLGGQNATASAESGRNRNELYLDAGGVMCSEPPELARRPLRDLLDSDIGCSTDWTATVTGVCLVCGALAGVVSVLGYLRWLRTLPPHRPVAGRTPTDLAAALYDHPHSHLAQPHRSAGPRKADLVLTPWDISYHDDFPTSDFPSASLQPKQNPPHIVFV